jgi:hypothetical protein
VAWLVNAQVLAKGGNRRTLDGPQRAPTCSLMLIRPITLQPPGRHEGTRFVFICVVALKEVSIFRSCDAPCSSACGDKLETLPHYCCNHAALRSESCSCPRAGVHARSHMVGCMRRFLAHESITIHHQLPLTAARCTHTHMIRSCVHKISSTV